MHMNRKKWMTRFSLALAIGALAFNAKATENVGQPNLKVREIQAVMGGCTAGVTQTTLDINNVRATILTDGDMWWNLVSAHYEIPKGGGAHSIFAGALWIGGVDAGGQLKVAAMTYRQNGIDFWPGPLDANTSVSSTECQKYDKHFPITKTEVQNFVNYGTMTSNIANWPGNNDADAAHGQLAPYVDVDGNGVYNPGPIGGYAGGDYPAFSLTSHPIACSQPQIFGDKALWWVYNDEGNIHTETHGNSIGLEVHAQAFAYSTSDEINNCTFYDYIVYNYSTVTLNNCYFGQWIDMDIGYPFDDYVGCDVTEGVGYTYNGLAVDGTGALGQYGPNPPACGADFFRGPKVDPTNPKDGIDANGVSFVDPNGRIEMAKFVYYNNDFTPQGNPTKAQDYYNYLQGFWIDGTPFTYGGNAYHGSGPVCDFMFPGTSDPTGKGTKNVPQATWSEVTAGDQPGDRRFMQSAGPFTLQPGAVNNVTVGVVWGRATQGGNTASIPVMMDADVKAQALFNNCFKIMNGPDAPDLTIQELGNSLILLLTNKSISNNYKEGYFEKDAYMTVNRVDTAYRFEGYQVFQLSDSTVTTADLNNPSKARQIFQCDVKNGVTQIINYYKDQSLGGVWVPQQMVLGTDSGITHSFVVTTDAFATGNSQLVNHKQYYFMAIAYGYNKGEVSADPINRTDGFNLPYISSRRNVRYQVGMPHVVSMENGGTVLGSSYGTGVSLTRIEGQGNGGQIIELTSNSINAILNSGLYDATNNKNGGRVLNPTYAANRGPITVTIIDPLSVPSGADSLYRISITDSTTKARWVLTNLRTGAYIKSDTVLSVGHEQLIPSMGLSIRASHVYENVSPGGLSVNGGPLDASMTFSDPTKPWLSALADQDITSASAGGDLNWIRSGKVNVANTDPDYPFNSIFAGGNPVDGNSYCEKILGGTWAPFYMCAYTDGGQVCTGGPGSLQYSQGNTFADMSKVLSSVNIVITADKSKWTRCPVLEMQENAAFAMGGAAKLQVRKSNSIDKKGYFYGQGGDNLQEDTLVSSTGMGWFPGYAINVETGERLNMAYGEDSGLPGENGRDMQWNPTSSVFDPTLNPLFGGKHYIYIFSHTGDLVQNITSTAVNITNGPGSVRRYDAGRSLWQLLRAGESNVKYAKQAFADAMWVNIPLLAQGHQLFETDVNIRIRWPRKYNYGLTGIYGNLKTVSTIDTVHPSLNHNYPAYTFSTKGLNAKTQIGSVAKNSLDLINIVPNPYYAYSGYETGQLDNRVRITNLPQTCTIRIYTLSGSLVRTFTKSDSYTYLDWNLQNHANVPIASGLYLIHIDVPGVGEKILKWFGVIRPQDLNSY